ncbi:hypothetical protein Q6244_28615, partial [Klebsiella pneumoniae]|nr:hypothetical protein [Klebsiella pneumoniae]
HHLIGSVYGIVGPILTGYIEQSTGTFDRAFVHAGTNAALGALLVRVVIDPPRGPRKASQAERAGARCPALVRTSRSA